MAESLENRIDNLLVKQKDYIISLINAGKLAEARAALNTVRDFWQGMDYGYKVKELQERLQLAENDRYNGEGSVR